MEEVPDPAEDESFLASYGYGVIGALVAQVVGLGSLLKYVTVMVHEAGHAVAGWLYGIPSLPTFNLIGGGGVTWMFQRSYLLGALIQGGLAWLVWQLRPIPAAFGAGLGAFAVYEVSFWTSLRVPVIGYGGHLAVVAVAVACWYRALAPRSSSRSGGSEAFERQLYGFFGTLFVLAEVTLAHEILTEPSFRAFYERGVHTRFTGPHTVNDLVGLGRWMGVSLGSVAVFHLVVALSAPVVACGLWFLQGCPRRGPGDSLA